MAFQQLLSDDAGALASEAPLKPRFFWGLKSEWNPYMLVRNHLRKAHPSKEETDKGPS